VNDQRSEEPPEGTLEYTMSELGKAWADITAPVWALVEAIYDRPYLRTILALAGLAAGFGIFALTLWSY
jgi:hypothetical protein